MVAGVARTGVSEIGFLGGRINFLGGKIGFLGGKISFLGGKIGFLGGKIGFWGRKIGAWGREMDVGYDRVVLVDGEDYCVGKVRGKASSESGEGLDDERN